MHLNFAISRIGIAREIKEQKCYKYIRDKILFEPSPIPCIGLRLNEGLGWSA